jgi:acyl-CoA synthetase (AMP-forming)/AMP-acid ligase II
VSSPGTSSGSLSALLEELPATDGAVVVHSPDGDDLTLGGLRAAVQTVATRLLEAGVGPGTPVGALVDSGRAAVVAMFAVWRAGAVYVPINRRLTPAEIAALVDETPVALLLGEAADLDRQTAELPMVELRKGAEDAVIRSAVPASGRPYGEGAALVLRTSGTTGRPKAIVLEHAGIIAALDSSLRAIRRNRTAAAQERPADRLRVNLIPVSLALWAGIFNTLFAFRAGFGVVLLGRFDPATFADVVRRHEIRSSVLPPAMIAMLCDAGDVGDLAPLRIVRSISTRLSPDVARRFHERFGVVVLNSYGQTELGGEVVGWTVEDIRTFGPAKLGAVGRPYDDVEVRIVGNDGCVLPPGDLGEVHIRSPYRMQGYAAGRATADVPDGDAAPGRLDADGFLQTGDLGHLDADGFLWIEGRVSDMINRGGLKIFPDEVEEVLRRHPSIRDAAVAALPDERLGEVPHAWVVPDGTGIDQGALAQWCREHLAPYKVPTGFTTVGQLPRSDVGKVLRRELAASHLGAGAPGAAR